MWGLGGGSLPRAPPHPPFRFPPHVVVTPTTWDAFSACVGKWDNNERKRTEECLWVVLYVQYVPDGM